MLFATFVVAIVLGLLFKFYLTEKRKWKLLEHIPGPKGVPIVGSVAEFAIHPTKLLPKMCDHAKKFGGLVKYNFFWMQSLQISDYDHIEAILGTTKVLDKSEEYEYLHKWLGTGLLTSGPEKWKKTRRIITPTFHFEILEQFIDVFDSCSNILIKKLKEIPKGTNVDIYEHSTLCALDVICESAMGTKVNAQLNSHSKYVTNVKEISRIIRGRLFEPFKILFFTYIFTKDYWLEKQILKELHEYTDSVIRKRRDELLNSTENVGKKRRLAFLDLLLQSKIDDRPMTDDEIRQEVDTFMFEGHDTTAFAIACTIYCLSQYSDIQQKVVDELIEIFGDDKFRTVTYEDLQNMKYLEMVIKETLRLYPSVPFYGRKALEETQIGTTTIPSSVTCTIFAWGLHRDPKIYPDPEKFDPERFTLKNQNERGPFSYIPFSAGPRNCIGQRFAMLEMKSTISKVLRNFEVVSAPDFTPEWLPDLILKPYNGLKVRLIPRN
ncbi:cytochrome P450 4c3-like [Onthophagus taurus]|uniref:cytochrome P450 4c3-like n=1 Tax=Onthophagus taurus TaxID=166361 RepID=UPI001F1250D8|nr:cytochrome P450 4c3-like [Onthophagus taurus]